MCISMLSALFAAVLDGAPSSDHTSCTSPFALCIMVFFAPRTSSMSKSSNLLSYTRTCCRF